MRITHCPSFCSHTCCTNQQSGATTYLPVKLAQKKRIGKRIRKEKTDEKTTMTEESSLVCKYLLGISPSLPDSCCCHSHNDLHHPHCNLLILMSLPELAVCDTWIFTTSTLILTFSSSHSRSRTSPQRSSPLNFVPCVVVWVRMWLSRTCRSFFEVESSCYKPQNCFTLFLWG